MPEPTAHRRPVARTFHQFAAAAWVGLIVGVVVCVMMVFILNARRDVDAAREQARAAGQSELSPQMVEQIKRASQTESGRVTGKMFVAHDYAGLGLAAVLWISGLFAWRRLASRPLRYLCVLLAILLTASLATLAFLFTPTINSLNALILSGAAPDKIADARATIDQLHPWASRLFYLNLGCLLGLFFTVGLGRTRS